ncbi:MAG: glycosyltransferase [Alphaproteobacteria bacterium]
MTAPRRVLCLLPDLDGGGSQRTMVNLVNAFTGHGIAASLAVARGGGPAKAWLDTQAELIELGCARTRGALLPLRALIRRSRPDILFSTMIDANLVAAAAALGMGASAPRLIVRETNSQRARGDLGALRRRAIGWAYRRAVRVVALSSGVREELIEDHRLDAGRVVTIGNPVAVEALAARADKARPAQAPWGDWAQDGPVMIGIGRLVRQKGFDLLIDALARQRRSDLRLILLGEGAGRPQLEDQVRRLDLGERVLMPGFAVNPADWLAHCDLFVLSSRWEGFGHVIAEAMACGVPVIAADCPHGPRDIIEDAKTGILVANQDASALARAIGGLLDTPKQMAALAKAARRAVGRFETGRIAGEYEALFAAVTSPKPE